MKAAFILFSASPSYVSPLEPPALKQAYRAVGRIGVYAHRQTRKNRSPVSLGSAVLIAPDKVLSNYHVWKNELEGRDENGLGVEFEARGEPSASGFIPFAPERPYILPKMDAVVLTLSRPSPQRPIWPAEQPADSKDVILIGYPATPRRALIGFEKMEREAVYGKPLVWDVKRWSKGQLVKLGHNTGDTYDYLAPMHQNGHEAKRAVLCHTASSVDGNSGGALICAKTGAFLGLHCGGGYFEGQDINFAVPARDLLQALKDLPRP